MLLLFTIFLIFILASRIIENSTKIPATLTLILFSFTVSFLYPNLVDITDKQFDEILYLMLPVILLPDILNLPGSELKRHYKEIVYLAIISVLVSVVIAVFITPYLMPKYSFTIGMLIALFSMLMATDAITVSSIMTKFKLPEKFKIYAESESLFNDVTALILFYFIAIPMISDVNLDIINITEILLYVLFSSTFIGAIIAYTGYFAIKFLKHSFDQLLVIYLIVSISFMIAEYFNVSGILAIITAVLAFKYLVQNNVNTLTTNELKEYKKESEIIGIFANGVVFTILANIIDVDLLVLYYKEILIIFVLTTLIRFLLISSFIVKLKLPFIWSKALTLAGAKGALAIIMVHSLPNEFVYKDMFTAVIIGNVLLSTFIYTILLMIHISNNKKEYQS